MYRRTDYSYNSVYVSRLLRRAVKKQLRAQSRFCDVQTIPGDVNAIFHRRQPASALIFLNCFWLTASCVISVLLKKTLPFHKFHYLFQFHGTDWYPNSSMNEFVIFLLLRNKTEFEHEAIAEMQIQIQKYNSTREHRFFMGGCLYFWWYEQLFNC